MSATGPSPLAEALTARLGFPVFDDEAEFGGTPLAAAIDATGAPALKMTLVGNEMLTDLRRRAARIAATLMFGPGPAMPDLPALTLETAVAGPAETMRNRIEMSFGRCPGA